MQYLTIRITVPYFNPNGDVVHRRDTVLDCMGAWVPVQWVVQGIEHTCRHETLVTNSIGSEVNLSTTVLEPELTPSALCFLCQHDQTSSVTVFYWAYEHLTDESLNFSKCWHFMIFSRGYNYLTHNSAGIFYRALGFVNWKTFGISLLQLPEYALRDDSLRGALHCMIGRVLLVEFRCPRCNGWRLNASVIANHALRSSLNILWLGMIYFV
jgi:hypothetical protein